MSKIINFNLFKKRYSNLIIIIYWKLRNKNAVRTRIDFNWISWRVDSTKFWKQRKIRWAIRYETNDWICRWRCWRVEIQYLRLESHQQIGPGRRPKFKVHQKIARPSNASRLLEKQRRINVPSFWRSWERRN